MAERGGLYPTAELVCFRLQSVALLHKTIELFLFFATVRIARYFSELNRVENGSKSGSTG